MDSPPAVDARRWAIGILVSWDCARISATLLGVRNQGPDIVAEVADGLIVQIPRETASLWAQLTDPGSSVTAAQTIESIGTLRARLSETQASVVDALLAQAGMAPARILAIGVHDPGLWSCGKAAGVSYLGLCEPARLAEATGMNVVDAFPARDVSAGGQGGPLTAIAEWMLLGHSRQNRLLLDFGRTTRLSYLGSRSSGRGLPRVLSFEVGPGMRLVDLLAQRFTNGEHQFDPGGRLAVQGQRLAPLLEHWLADPYFRRSIPRWHPLGVRPERFLFDALQMGLQSGWSVRALLCTATHFVAESVAMAVRRDLPDDANIEGIVLAGGGQHNGMLLRELTRLFPNLPMLRVSELGIESESLAPACVAMLALLHLDQVPGNSPEVTGAEVPRVLGHLTPGSPQSWQRLVASLGGSRPSVRPLRSAI
jgi:anhydro-N-acetylmuramic acid kinase